MASPAELAASTAIRRQGPSLVLATELGEVTGGLATAAGAAVGAAAPGRGVVLAELGAARRRAPTLLASARAGELEGELRSAGFGGAAARGRLCWLSLAGGEEGLGELARALSVVSAELVVAHLPAAEWRAALERTDLRVAGGVLRAELPRDRALAALAVSELRELGVRARVAPRPLGRIATIRALAGLDPGGAAGRRMARMVRALDRLPQAAGAQSGQALPLTLGVILALALATLLLAALGGAATGALRAQRAADLAALSAVRSMRDDLPRLLAPAQLPGGAPNPAHLDRADYLSKAIAATREAAARNAVAPARLRVTFPDAGALTPLRARVAVRASVDPGAVPGATTGPATLRRELASAPIIARAEAQASPPAGFSGSPAVASGGGYSGPLAYRQGEPMRPDVARAFDRLATAARRDGLALTVNSGYRSDAEQAVLWRQNPDPRWVAPPGRSLHRCGTELDLGPPAAYGWLGTNARRFGFVQRYKWESWHFGYVRGPAPCSAATGLATRAGGVPDGEGAASGGLPGYVPQSYRAVIARSGARWSVSAAVLAAQLLAESGFDPAAASPAGALGIAQFMPATARAYGLRDPFDPAAAIDAQAHLMSDLLHRFGSLPLALAAYNAGPAAVEACGCVPSYPETQAHVARILGLLDGAGELAVPELEVRLVR